MRSPALVLLVGLLAGAACGEDPTQVTVPEVQGVAIETGQSADHVEGPVAYDADPPSGGDHHRVWLDCGFYDEAVPNEHAVHALEHGVVWLAHQPGIEPDKRNTLRALFELAPGRIIVSPYPDLEAEVVAVAWERRLVADGVEDPRLVQFVDAYVDAPSAPEPRASCTGGVGAGGLGAG